MIPSLNDPRITVAGAAGDEDGFNFVAFRC